MATASNSRGLIGLIKKGWNEIPEVMGSCVVGLIGLGLTANALYHYYANDGNNRKYKEIYTVYRHDDPRVAKLKE
ncbi:NADH:ubiquinone oxidoreductase subunit A3 [Rhynchophorus ferrugineus]|uniref:NADH:ubiquinone oxidoreductase subunit A3 n=1 Tax=Rhynchophorus ferrugineus TaxID=354439 RepID=UPI003FCCE4A9